MMHTGDPQLPGSAWCWVLTYLRPQFIPCRIGSHFDAIFSCWQL